MKRNLGMIQLLRKIYQQPLIHINKALGINLINLAETFNKILIFCILK
jgi:hypothetical protein